MKHLRNEEVHFYFYFYFLDCSDRNLHRKERMKYDVIVGLPQQCKACTIKTFILVTPLIIHSPPKKSTLALMGTLECWIQLVDGGIFCITMLVIAHKFEKMCITQ